MKYNVYIDESGDEGIKKGSKWFILTAVVVPDNFDLTLSNKIVSIKNNLGMNRKDQLHWNKILNHDKKVKIIYDLINENFKIIHVAIDTYGITKLKSKDLYPYFMSYLIERVSYYIKSQKSTCNIIISTRNDNSQLKNEHLKQELMNKRNYHSINTKVIDSIKFVDNNKRNLLQLADVCCSSFAQAIKYNTSKEWEYVIKLKTNIYASKNGIIGTGIKFYPPIDWAIEFPNLVLLI